MTVKSYITKSGFKEQQELRKNLSKKASELLEQISENRSQEFGDESENSELIRLNLEITSVRTQEAKLIEFFAACVVIDVDNLPEPNGIVRFGTLVEIEDIETGEVHKYQIVGDSEAKPKNGTLSYMSPLGSQLIGKSEGDSIGVKTPSGYKEYEILSVSLIK